MMHTLALQYENLQAPWQGLFALCCAVAMFDLFLRPNKQVNKCGVRAAFFNR
jgi:hypothetical protein